MDDPNLESGRHIAALHGLARLNWLSGSVRIVWASIAGLARKLGNKRLRVLDVATGGGDVPLALWRKARRAGLNLDLCGVDISERALRFASSRAEACGAEIRFQAINALTESLPAEYDVAMCSLFLHHLNEEQATTVLSRMRAAARRLVLVNDLRRSRTGLLLAQLATRLFTTSNVVHVDGPRSARAAFTVEEVQILAESAGMPDARIERRWPCRFLLQCPRTGGTED